MDCGTSLPYACAVGAAGDRAPTWAVDLDILGGWEKSSCGFRYSMYVCMYCMYVHMNVCIEIHTVEVLIVITCTDSILLSQ